MPRRGYVLVFFLWALLTIITPTLIFWSAAAKPGLSSPGEDSEQKMARRMMGYLENKREFARGGEAPISSPAPAPTPRTA